MNECGVILLALYCTILLRYWWTSLAISTEIEVIFVGGNTGKAVLLDLAGNIVSSIIIVIQ